MKVRRRVWKAAGAIALALVSLGAVGAAPSSADPGFVQLNIAAMSPQYSVNGCRYKILYGDFGRPFTWIRVYGGCSAVTAGIRSLDFGGTYHWDSGAINVGTGTDGCGAYTQYQANGRLNSFASGAYILGTGTTGSFLKVYDYDGDQTQAPHSLC